MHRRKRHDVDDHTRPAHWPAHAGASLQVMACEGSVNAVSGPILAREIAVATVQAVVSTQAFCESNGGPGAMACGMTMGTVTDIATAQVLASCPLR